jgi:hypothetical protein
MRQATLALFLWFLVQRSSDKAATAKTLRIVADAIDIVEEVVS